MCRELDGMEGCHLSQTVSTKRHIRKTCCDQFSACESSVRLLFLVLDSAV